MFKLFRHKYNLSVHEVGQLIDRFLRDAPQYPQEWNDFVETSQRNPAAEHYRKLCHDLDPLVNRPQPRDPSALSQLRALASSARRETYLEVAQILEGFASGTGARWDWDDYLSVMSFSGDPYLETLRQRMDGLQDEFPAGPARGYCSAAGLEVIGGYVEALRAKAEAFAVDVPPSTS